MREISPAEAQTLLADGEATLLDVREPWEIALAGLKPALCIPMQELPGRLNEIEGGQAIIVFCHHGVRSQHAALFLEQNGWTTVFSLTGGIDAWSREIDPKIPVY